MINGVQRDQDAAGMTLSTKGVPMALAGKFQLNPQAKPFIPTVKAYERLESRRGKRNTEGAEPIRKHRIWPRRGGSVGRRGPRGPNLARETNKSGENGNKGKGKRLYIEKLCSHARKGDEVEESVASQKRKGAVQRQGDRRSV